MADPNKMLREIGKSAPVLNQNAVKQQKAANAILTQQQLGAAPAQPNIIRAAQTVAPQQTLQTGIATVGGMAQTRADAGKVADMSLANQATKQAQQNRRAQIGQGERLARKEQAQERTLSGEVVASRKRITQDEIIAAKVLQQAGIEQDNNLLNLDLAQRQKLARIGEDVKGKIFDSRTRFERDELGRKFSNQRQLADYAIASAKTEQEFKMKMQGMQQVFERKIQVMERSASLMEDAAKRGFLSAEQRLDHASQERLMRNAAALRKQIKAEKARANNNMMMVQGIGTIGGAIIGGVAAGAVSGGMGAPAGAAMGASIGGGAATTAYGATQ